MSELKNIIEGIIKINRESDIEDDFVKSLKENLNETDDDAKERLLRELYNCMRESGDIDFLNKILTDKEVLFFAKRIGEKIANSTLQDEQIRRIEKVDSDILCNRLTQISEENVSGALDTILNAFSTFIEQHMLNSQFNINAHTGAQAFKDNIYLFKTIFCVTLKNLNDSDTLTKYKNLYQCLIFEYFPLFESDKDNNSLRRSIVILSFLWVSVKEILKLDANNITVTLRRNNEGTYNHQLNALIGSVFTEVSKMDNKELKPYLKMIANFDKLYDFLSSLEIIKQSESEGFKKKVVETLIELYEEDEEIRKNQSVILIDFHILLSKYAKDKYLDIIKKITNENKKWFLDKVLENLKAEDNENREIILDETVGFLLEESIKDKWNKNIERELINLLKEKMELQGQLNEFFEEDEHYIYTLLQEIVDNRSKELGLVYIPFGKEFFECVKSYLLGEDKNEGKVLFMMSKISRILKTNDIDTLFQNLLNFIKDNLENIQMDKLENLISSNKRQFKKGFTQKYLESVGKEVISSTFGVNPTQIFLILLKFSRRFKDTINLEKNIRKYKQGKQEDEEILKILNEIGRLLKTNKEKGL